MGVDLPLTCIGEAPVDTQLALLEALTSGFGGGNGLDNALPAGFRVVYSPLGVVVSKDVLALRAPACVAMGAEVLLSDFHPARDNRLRNRRWIRWCARLQFYGRRSSVLALKWHDVDGFNGCCVPLLLDRHACEGSRGSDAVLFTVDYVRVGVSPITEERSLPEPVAHVAVGLTLRAFGGQLVVDLLAEVV